MIGILHPSRLAHLLGHPRRAHRSFPLQLEQFEGRVVPSLATGISASFQTVGDNELVTITNNSNGAVKINVADYAFTQNFFDQHFVKSSSVDVKAGKTKTISIELECNAFNQLDVLAGEDPIKDFQGVPNYLFDPHLVGATITPWITCPPQEGKTHGNEGLGNGVDPPPPGHAGDAQQNDDPGHGPGNPNKGWNS